MTATQDEDDTDGAEDDYMNMAFEEPVPAKETSLQRTQRLKKESRQRGIIKSKAELAEEEVAARERALSTSILDGPQAKTSKGLAMMAKMGFAGGGLGKKAEDGSATGRLEPIQVNLKDNRGGIGLDSEKKRKLREAAEEVGAKAFKLDPDDYRESVRKEREDQRLEKQFHAAQRMAEQMDDEDAAQAPTEASSSSSKKDQGEVTKGNQGNALKAIPVLYRGLIRHRREVERDRRMRHDLEQSLSRLPTYDDESEDEDDKLALGKQRTIYAGEDDDLNEEDEELETFNALEAGQRLEKLLLYLREKHRYCFWCKTKYADEDLDGCPGITEDAHD